MGITILFIQGIWRSLWLIVSTVNIENLKAPIFFLEFLVTEFQILFWSINFLILSPRTLSKNFDNHPVMVRTFCTEMWTDSFDFGPNKSNPTMARKVKGNSDPLSGEEFLFKNFSYSLECFDSDPTALWFYLAIKKIFFGEFHHN